MRMSSGSNCPAELSSGSKTAIDVIHAQADAHGAALFLHQFIPTCRRQPLMSRTRTNTRRKNTRSTKIRKVAKLMRDLDFCMFITHTARGGFHARPMSNNGEVEFDGDVWFFSAADSRKVREIEADPTVHLAYVDPENWRFVSMIGRARIVRDARKKKELWMEELEQWFDEGPESDAIVLIRVRPAAVSFWTKREAGELRIG